VVWTEAEIREEVTVDSCDAKLDPNGAEADTLESNTSKPGAASLSLSSPVSISSGQQKMTRKPDADAEMLRSWVRSSREAAEALDDPRAIVTQTSVGANRSKMRMNPPEGAVISCATAQQGSRWHPPATRAPVQPAR
jgi:hypothetical protein